MPDINRRSVLKGAVASSAGLVGFGAISSVADPGNGNGPPDDPGGGDDGPAEQTECQPPNELLATFEWDGSEFVAAGGRTELVQLSVEDTNGDITFTWKSEVPVAFVAVTAGGGVSRLQGDVDSDKVDVPSSTDTVSFCVRPAQAVLGTVEPDGFDVETHLESPSVQPGQSGGGGNRSGSVHVTSPAGATTDYVAGTVNVAFEQPELIIDDLGSGDVVYDFLEGVDNSNAVPDEAFLILQTPDQRDDSPSGPDKFDVAYLTRNQAVTQGEWQTRDLGAELNGSVQRNWRINTINSGDILTARGIINTATSLRDPETSVADLGAYYDLETRILGVGFGFGYTNREQTLDAYFDALEVRGTEYDFPATVPLEVTDASNNGTTEVEMQLGNEDGVSASDVVADSVRLTGLVKVAPAPPTEQQGGTQASDVTVTGNTITATFDTDTSGEFLVSGDFDVDREQIVSFLAEGSI